MRLNREVTQCRVRAHKIRDGEKMTNASPDMDTPPGVKARHSSYRTVRQWRSTASVAPNVPGKELDMTMFPIHRAIQLARTERKLSQKELAASVVGGHTQLIVDFESGRSVPKDKIIRKIEKILNATLPRPVMTPLLHNSGKSNKKNRS